MATVKRRVASMKEINEFWTAIVRNEEASASERFKASELLSKSILSKEVKGDVLEAADLKWFKEEDLKE